MRQNRIVKTIVIFIASIIALAMSGATYALWYDDLYIDIYAETGDVEWEFYNRLWEFFPDSLSMFLVLPMRIEYWIDLT